MPFGRVQDSVTRPTGSARPRTTSRPSAIASTRWSFKVSRSIMAGVRFAVLPAAKSSALAGRISDLPARMADAMPASARSFCAVPASASTRAAALARRPMSLMVAAISPDSSMVFSGAVMVDYFAGTYARSEDIRLSTMPAPASHLPPQGLTDPEPVSRVAGLTLESRKEEGHAMILIDLSRDIEHKMAVLPNHPQVIVTAFATHDEVRVADGYGFSSATMALVMGDHAGTHVDAPKHFNADPNAKSIDEVPLENFFTEAVCLDLSHKALKSDISIEDLEKAEQAAGVTIKPNDTVLLHMDFFRRTHGTPGFITDFPGLTKESATWLGNKGIGMFGVEAVSPGRPGRNNFEVHHVCRDLGFTHMEGLVNLDKLVGKGRFRFIGFPIKIKGGTGAPIRAVAWLDG